MSKNKKDTYSKKGLKKIRKRFPLLLLAMPVMLPYTFIREIFENQMTVRGWADMTFCQLLEVAEIFFTGSSTIDSFKSSGRIEKREKVRSFMELGFSKEFTRELFDRMGTWGVYKSTNQLGEKYFSYDRSHENSNNFIFLTKTEKGIRVKTEYRRFYGNGKDFSVNSKYLLDESQAMEVVKYFKEVQNQ